MAFIPQLYHNPDAVASYFIDGNALTNAASNPKTMPSNAPIDKFNGVFGRVGRKPGAALSTISGEIREGLFLESFSSNCKASVFLISTSRYLKTVLCYFPAGQKVRFIAKSFPVMPTKTAKMILGNSLRHGVLCALFFLIGTHIAEGSEPVRSAKKGVGTWVTPITARALTSLNLDWYYTWESNRDRLSALPGVEFVPMIWGAQFANAVEIARAKSTGSTNLLGFNEPDHRDQSRLTVEQALDLWPILEQSGLRLGSPATSFDPTRPGSWLERFMEGVKTRNYRVDFICAHWYGSGTNLVTETAKLKAFLESVHAKFQRPIWLTEFALVNWSDGKQSADAITQAMFANRALPILEALPFLERYAWFAVLPWRYGSAPVPTHLCDPDLSLTIVGQVYRDQPLKVTRAAPPSRTATP
jgi:hypothetical protein